jgi:hypothetical protein
MAMKRPRIRAAEFKDAGGVCSGAIAKWHDKRQGKACMQVRNTLNQTYSMSGIESSVDWSSTVEGPASN